MRALPLLLLTGCALFRPLPDPLDRAFYRLQACIKTEFALSRHWPETCAAERADFCRAVGQRPGCREAREQVSEFQNRFAPIPNPNQVGPP